MRPTAPSPSVLARFSQALQIHHLEQTLCCLPTAARPTSQLLPGYLSEGALWGRSVLLHPTRLKWAGEGGGEDDTSVTSNELETGIGEETPSFLAA